MGEFVWWLFQGITTILLVVGFADVLERRPKSRVPLLYCSIYKTSKE